MNSTLGNFTFSGRYGSIYGVGLTAGVINTGIKPSIRDGNIKSNIMIFAQKNKNSIQRSQIQTPITTQHKKIHITGKKPQVKITTKPPYQNR